MVGQGRQRLPTGNASSSGENAFLCNFMSNIAGKPGNCLGVLLDEDEKYVSLFRVHLLWVSDIVRTAHKSSYFTAFLGEAADSDARMPPLHYLSLFLSIRATRSEHEHLARQVKDLTAKLAAARVRIDDYSSSGDSNLSSEESAAYTSSTTYTTSEQTGTTKTTREEAASSHDTSGEQAYRKCGYDAFAAAEADDIAARQHERERLASRREWRIIRDSRLRQMRGGNLFSPASSRHSSSNGQSESDTWQDYVGRVDDVDDGQRSKSEGSSSASGRSWFGRRGSSHSQSGMNSTTAPISSNNNGSAGREKAGFWQGKEIEEVY